MDSPDVRVKEPGAWMVRGLYKLAHWPRAEGGYYWEVSHAGRVISRFEQYGEALAAVAAHQANNLPRPNRPEKE